MDTQTIYRRRWGILSVLIVSLLAIVIDNTETEVDPADEYLVDLWPGDFADQSHGVEG